VADTKAGETLGQGVNGVWFLVSPAATAAGGTITGGVDQPSAGATQAPATAAPATTGQGGPSGSAESVAISGFAFAPASISVAVGTTVTWTNDDAATHTVTAAGGTFDSGNLSRGQTFSRTFDAAGTFTYQCSIHPSMTGTVTAADPTAY
jgi:plastocyanin